MPGGTHECAHLEAGSVVESMYVSNMGTLRQGTDYRLVSFPVDGGLELTVLSREL